MELKLKKLGSRPVIPNCSAWGAESVDSWESFFREKSARRASFRNRRTFRVALGGTVAGVAAIMAVIAGLNALMFG